jgi:predicted TIM-barrel fold metal-dependent hydrolase
MVIDFHTHIFPKSIRDRRDRYFSSEPAFRLLYESPKSKMVGAKELIQTMDAEGVDKSVVFGFPWRQLDTLRTNNDYVMECIQRFPTRLIGFCCLGPLGEGSLREVERCLQGGVAGVGELAFYETGLDDTAMEILAPVMDICRERQLPVMIHTNEPVGHRYPGKMPITLTQIYQMVQRFRDVPIVLAHWGGGIFFYHLLKKEVKEVLSNVFVDTAASPFLYDPEIYSHAVNIFGPERILFGSDFPLIKPGRYFRDMTTADLSEPAMAAVLGGNAAKLLRL